MSDEIRSLRTLSSLARRLALRDGDIECVGASELTNGMWKAEGDGVVGVMDLLMLFAAWS
jgi:hypothetical protein